MKNSPDIAAILVQNTSPAGSRGLAISRCRYWMVDLPLATAGRTKLYGCLFVAMSFAAVLAFGFDWPFRSHERKVNGRTTEQWAWLLTAHPVQHRDILPPLGAALVPHLIRQIESFSNPSRGELGHRLLLSLYQRSPAGWLPFFPEMIPRNERRLNAIILLGWLGPRARGAVPTLIPLLEDEEVSASVVQALQAIGSEARMAIPSLLRKISEEPMPQLATALASLAPTDPAVIQALRNAQLNGSRAVQLEAAAALKKCEVELISTLALLRGESSLAQSKPAAGSARTFLNLAP